MMPTLEEFNRVKSIDDHNPSEVLRSWGFSERDQKSISMGLYGTQDINKYKLSVTANYIIKLGIKPLY